MTALIRTRRLQLPPPLPGTGLISAKTALLLAVLLAALASSAANASEVPDADAISVLVHPELSVLPLSRSELQAIFTLRKRRWDAKTPVRVFVLRDDHPLHQGFCKFKLGVYPYVLREHWDRIMFSGTGYPPTVVDDIDAMHSAVMSTPGAIGYTLSATAPAAVLSISSTLAPDSEGEARHD